MIPKIKRFKLKDGITLDDIKNISSIREGGSWINENSAYFISKNITPGSYNKYETTAEIGFPHDLSTWNDFDYILVLDEAFCQPYTPFYSFMDGQIPADDNFPFLEGVVMRYNEEMSGLDFLEEK